VHIGEKVDPSLLHLPQDVVYLNGRARDHVVQVAVQGGAYNPAPDDMIKLMPAACGMTGILDIE
jgi:hypothetical protein